MTRPFTALPMALLTLAAPGCAHVTDPWAATDRAQEIARAQADPGLLELDERLDFGVPCANRTVTVFVIRDLSRQAQKLWVAPQEAKLDPLGLTTVAVDYRPGRRRP